MNGTTYTVEFPQNTNLSLEKRAQQARRSVEAEIRELVTVAIDKEEEEVQELLDSVQAMANWPDADLVRAARNPLVPEWVKRLEELHLKQQREGLTATEKEIEATLANSFEKSMLVRANALALLKGRGHDVTGLLGVP